MLGDCIGLSGLIESAAIATVASLGAVLGACLAACLAGAPLPARPKLGLGWAASDA
jgi:hypothetical protein